MISLLANRASSPGLRTADLMALAASSAHIEKAVAAMADAGRIFVLTGAGISAESGVPTFRGGGGSSVWRGMPFEVLSSAGMVEKDLPLLWEWFDYRREMISKCAPNDGHIAIAQAQQSSLFDDFTLVTQNIDGLHRIAGSSKLLEMHGNINQARCRHPPQQTYSTSFQMWQQGSKIITRGCWKAYEN